MGATFTGFMLNNRLGKGIKGNSAVEETGQHNLDQVTGFNTLNGKSYELHTIVVYMARRVSHFCDALPAKILSSSLTMRKILNKPKLTDILKMASAPQNLLRNKQGIFIRNK